MNNPFKKKEIKFDANKKVRKLKEQLMVKQASKSKEVTLEQKMYWRNRCLDVMNQLVKNGHNPYFETLSGYLYHGQLSSDEIQKKVKACGTAVDELTNTLLMIKIQGVDMKKEEAQK